MSTSDRLHALDAVRAFALLLGVLFHAAFSFIPGLPPGIWAMVDRSPSTTLAVLSFTSHAFRMSLFFFIAGFFGRMLFERLGPRGFWVNRGKRILLPLVAGWLVLFPAIAAVWVWGITRTFGGTLPAPPANMPPPPPGAFPLTHLWFLYYLLVLYAAVLAGRAAVVAVDRGGWIGRTADRVIEGAARSRAAVFLLAVPVSLALYLRADWIAWFGVPTPDRSIIPEGTSLVAFGAAVAFGWLVHRQAALLGVWQRQWPIHLALAIATTGVCLAMLGLTPTLVPVASGVAKLGLAVAFAVAIWSWNFAVLGFAMRFLSRPHAGIRYMSDASYWIYLAHLPVVAAAQVMVGQLPWHWAIKFPVIVGGSLLLLLASYHFVVRPTFIGQLLNGRRHPRRLATALEGSATAGTANVDPLSAPLAALDAAHKAYGRTVALDGLDLHVEPGELLAVLGPNGAGKSTAIALWLGLLEPDRGTARLFGRSPLDVEARRRVGVMMQDAGLTPELHVRELVDLAASYYPDPLSTAETLALARLDALARRPYGKLSTGQKRLVQFALAICGRPRLLFLDEPTVGLDVEARETVWRTIRALLGDGCSVVLTTHYLEEAEALADRVAVLAGGRLVALGTVAEIRALTSRSEISCASAVAEDDVRRWPDVVGVLRESDRLRITAREPEDVVRRLLAADAGLRHLEVRRAGLAAAFTELTREVA